MEMSTFAIVALAIFNLSTVVFLALTLRNVDLRKAVSEKAPDVSVPGAPSDSYSRVAGMLGSVVMVTLFWAIANAVVYFSFFDPTRLGTLLNSAGSLLFYGASMFLPYAANQLRAMFPAQGK
ncbi:MAG: hypothetical protein ACRCUE_00965 [Bosea sp. (in: a-proteobacteria)]